MSKIQFTKGEVQLQLCTPRNVELTTKFKKKKERKKRGGRGISARILNKNKKRSVINNKGLTSRNDHATSERYGIC